MAQQARPEFMAVTFTQPWDDGSSMPEWHQHMTIFHWMRGDAVTVAGALALAAPSIDPIDAYVLGIADFGAKEPLPVWLLEPRPALQALQTKLLALASPYGKLQDDTFTGGNFTPHITIQPNQLANDIGASVCIDTVSIVQKVGDARIILKTVWLGR